MVDTALDKPVSVELGISGTNHTLITNVFAVAHRLVAVGSPKHISLIKVINKKVPDGVHQNVKIYEVEIILDSDCYYAFYTQEVQAADAAARALVEDGDNDWIDWFVINKLTSVGGAVEVTYETKKVLCVGNLHEYNNEENARHLTTYRFICIGTRLEA